MSFLAVVTNNPKGDCDRIHGTFKITGVGTFAIENCGDCNCNVLIKQIDDNAFHPPYDDSNIITDDSQLPIEVKIIKSLSSLKSAINNPSLPD